ncbi:hypothetical protein KI688_000789 [Linnemannia hyalina]|uniref:DUF4246 domain-containing protein n=1 Tax=Linnemannia hyalina TaxID=64524 RepID=A0A9P7Y615_9FUNG|nr:hypothetical protein KI688_000789 [Linnemannia hyalina]
MLLPHLWTSSGYGNDRDTDDDGFEDDDESSKGYPVTLLPELTMCAASNGIREKRDYVRTRSITLWHEEDGGKGLKERLITCVQKLEDVPEDEKDWDPGTDDKILDLVHSSLFPFIASWTLVTTKEMIPPLAHIGGGKTKKRAPHVGGLDSTFYLKRSWHVKGMANENIVTIEIYYYNSENITESRRLNFYHYIAFPNTFQHQVQPFRLQAQPALDSVFFLADPEEGPHSVHNIRATTTNGCSSGTVTAASLNKRLAKKLSPEIARDIERPVY